MSDSKTRVAAIGAIQPGGKLTIIASAAQFNEGKEGILILPTCDVAFISGEKYQETIEEILGTRAAEVGLNPDNLSEVAKEAHKKATEARHNDIHSFEALLNALRTGEVESLAPMSEATLEAIDSEKIGEEFSTTGGHFQ
jgi:hypothetical protein